MYRKKLLPIILISALAITAIFGVIAYRTASAQALTPTMPSTITITDKGLGRHGVGGYTSENLAGALGITTEQLNTAYQKANDEALTQAVSKDLITQTQADQIRANGSAFPLGNQWAGWLAQNGIDYDTLLANALGITVDKLQAAYLQAYNAGIDQAVSNGQLTQQQADLMKGKYALYNNKDFQSSMQSAFKTAVQNAVTAGLITQEQADQILSAENVMDGQLFGRFGGSPMMDGPRGFGGPGQWGGMAPNNPAPAQPTPVPSNG